MALFKILRGSSSSLKDLPLKDGFCYFTPDTGLFYIDYEKDGVIERIPLNAAGSNTLAGANLVHDILNNREDEIPSSALLSKEIDKINTNKQDKISGDVGQIAGFDANGDLVAIDFVGNTDFASGIIETNTGALIKLWYGTTAEYEAIGTKDNDTIYILSDDNSDEIVANEVVYDNGVSGLLATNVQAALDEIATTTGKAGYVFETNKGLQQKFWRGTQAEYDVIETKDEDTMYIIIGEDGKNVIDGGGSSSDVYTKAEVDALIATAITTAIETAVANITRTENTSL